MGEIVSQNLLELESHFSFGENWAEYAQKIDEKRIEEAESFFYPCIGLLGADCDEYSLTRKPASNSTSQKAN